jgi:N6-adenosine-specific RNA methylase IME4
LADPPWRFTNRTGKVAPEHKRLNRYETLSLNEIKTIPVSKVTAQKCHLYLWVPNALLQEGLEVLKHGDLLTNQTSYGIKLGKMVDQTAEALVFISEIQLN